MKNALKKTLCGIGSCAVVVGGLLYFRAHTEPSPLPVSEPPAAQSAVSERKAIRRQIQQKKTWRP